MRNDTARVKTPYMQETRSFAVAEKLFRYYANVYSTVHRLQTFHIKLSPFLYFTLKILHIYSFNAKISIWLF